MKSFEEIWPELIDRLQPLEEERVVVRAKVRRTWVIIALVSPPLLLFCAWLFVYTGSGAIAGLVLIPCLMVIYGIYYMGAQRHQNNFRDKFKEQVIRLIVQSAGPDFQYQPQTHVSMEHYHHSRLFLKGVDRHKGEDLVSGTVGQTKVEFSELHTEYKTQSRNSNGGSTTHWHTIFRGIFMIADPNKHFESETYVIQGGASDGFLGRMTKWVQSATSSRGERIEMENPEFNKFFAIYTTDAIEARYLLTPDFIDRVLSLRQKSKELSLSFTQDRLFLAVSTPHDYFKPDLNRSLLESESVQIFYEELKGLLDIVEMLDLNTRIWSKQ